MEVFYVGDAQPFFSAPCTDGFGVNFASVQNRPVFVRVRSYASLYYGVSERVDQTPGYTFIDPKQQGVIIVHPRTNGLTPTIRNLR